jgi:hypothetical protein
LTESRAGYVKELKVEAGERIAVLSVERFSTPQTLLVAGVALLALVMFLFLFRSAVTVAVLILVLALASVTAWALHPYLVPKVLKVYQAMPSTPEATARDAADPDQAQNHPGDTSLASAERRAVEILNHRPDPRLVAFAVSFTGAFLLYGLILGRAVRALKPRAH